MGHPAPRGPRRTTWHNLTDVVFASVAFNGPAKDRSILSSVTLKAESFDESARSDELPLARSRNFLSSEVEVEVAASRRSGGPL